MESPLRTGRTAWREFAAAGALGVLALVTFSPFLLRPDRFPAGGSPQAAGRAIADAVVREQWLRASGEISWVDPDLGGRNRAADGDSFYTHPLYHAFSRVLPGGLSLSLVGVLHLLLLGPGTLTVARRLGYAPGPSLFSGTVAVLAGAAALDLASPPRMGAAASASLVPALALVLRAVLDRPSAPRLALLSMLAALAGAGDLPSFALAVLFAAGTAAWLGGTAAGGAARAAKGLLPAVLAVSLGAALIAYRALPRAVGDFAGWSSLEAIRAGPFWTGGGPLSLPFFLGVITLLALAAAVGGRGREKRAVALTGFSVLVALLSPRILIAFIGLPLALAAGAGAARVATLLPARVPVSALLALALTLEAAPYYRARLTTRSAADIAAAPRWAQFLGAASGGERAAILGREPDGLANALSALGVPRVSADLPEKEPPRAARFLGILGARHLVCDLPEPGSTLPLVHADREAGKYVYLNPERLGLAWWTQRVETRSAADRAPPGQGAVALPPGSFDPPGEAFGPVKDARRLANGVSCEVNLPEAAYLVFTEPFLPGFEASLNGKPGKLLEANLHQPCLLMPAGRHQVRLVFRPPGLAAGAAISAVAAAVLPVLLAAPLLAALARRGRSGKGPKPPSLSAGRQPPVAGRQHQRAPRISATSSRLWAMWSGR